MILVFTTSNGVVISAAVAPDAAAAAAFTAPTPVSWRSEVTPSARAAQPSPSTLVGRVPVVCSGPWPRRRRRNSNMGNWSAVNGRFLAARALYPAHNLRQGPPSLCQTMCRALREDDCRLPPAAESRNTWAFCLMTSAGVSTEQEANSAAPEASAWTAACGTAEGRAVPRADFADSYVRKKTPARGTRQ